MVEEGISIILLPIHVFNKYFTFWNEITVKWGVIGPRGGIGPN
jgi:hypothetical protein